MAKVETDPSHLEALEERLNQVQEENRRLSEIVGRLSTAFDKVQTNGKKLLLPNGKETKDNGLAVQNGLAVVDRRTALRNLGKAAAAGVGLAAASTLLKPGTAHAAHGGGNFVNADADAALHVDNTGAGRAIIAESTSSGATILATNAGTGEVLFLTGQGPDPAVDLTTIGGIGIDATNNDELPTLRLDNNFNSSGGGPTLRLNEGSAAPPTGRGIGGELMVFDDSGLDFKDLFFLHFGTEKTTPVLWGRVATDGNFSTNELSLFSTPNRILDTRDSTKRPIISDPGSGTADPLPDGDYELNLSSALSSTATAIFATLTAVHANSAGLPGFLSLWASGAAPATSNINFGAGNTSGIATLAMTGVDGEHCMLRVAAGNAGVHVILDLISQVLPSTIL